MEKGSKQKVYYSFTHKKNFPTPQFFQIGSENSCCDILSKKKVEGKKMGKIKKAPSSKRYEIAGVTNTTVFLPVFSFLPNLHSQTAQVVLAAK